MSWFRNLAKISTLKSLQSSSSSPAAKLHNHHTPPNYLFNSLSHFTSNAFASASAAPKPTPYAGLEPTREGAEKPRVVVLGTGWAACRLMKGIDTNMYDVVCVSPRNHMVFTPLLASTCVGTLEFRSVAEPIGRIQPAISKEPGSYFFLAKCTALDTNQHVVHCETVTDGPSSVAPWKFNISYDKLVIALGAEASTFGIHGVKEHAIFLREVYHAQEIRRRLLLNLMLSDVPGVSEGEKKRLLHCVVVGGGPTGVEFSGELSDFIMRDVRQRYAHVKDYIHVTLIEANEILSSFDDRLRRYATNQLTKSGVRLVRGTVKDVEPQQLILNDGTEVPYGLLVWSTGVGPSPLVKSLDLPKSPGGRIGIDEWLRVPSVEDVFAIGDCSGFLETTGKPVLPALAQVAERQGKYLASLLNKIGKAGGGRANSAKDMEFGDPFVYKHLGSMATIGSYKALVDLRQSKEGRGISLAGFVSWFVWRSAYLTRVISWRNRLYVAINWATTFVFGRDISRI
ncbi:tubulin alpha 1 [Turnera subulata]|uniref:NADH:ubiquinone reductase (non-electrogenic) n=1 Tax=Turnera subulata TaxID=218843 RepID=A0A9Q0JGK7_9ROSI|nr:tubulin alpha 1 [Turnera subulata]